MRRFVILGRHASASGDFLLDDLPGTSGRLDVLVRCVRAALLVSHGVRRDAIVYLVLGGGAGAPRVLRVEGSAARYLRPDERSLATLFKKALATSPKGAAESFAEARPGVAVASGGVERVLADVGRAQLVLLETEGADVRGQPALDAPDVALFVGDHTGFDAAARSRLLDLGACCTSVGPLALHAEDAVVVATNELDRREAARRA